MPCMRVSSDGVALGSVTALQGGFGVWGRLAQSGEIWGRWSLDWSWFAGPPGQVKFDHGNPNRRRSMTLDIGGRVVAAAGSASTPRPTAMVRGSSPLTPPGCSATTRLRVGAGGNAEPSAVEPSCVPVRPRYTATLATRYQDPASVAFGTVLA